MGEARVCPKCGVRAVRQVGERCGYPDCPKFEDWPKVTENA